MQFAFRAGRSTKDNLAPLFSKIQKSFEQGEYTATLFADVTGACQNIRPQILKKKLLKAGLPRTIVTNIMNTLVDRRVTVTYQGKMVGPRSTSVGLNQGDIWAPLLYLLYTADIDMGIEEDVVTIQFADDICLASSNKSAREATYCHQDAAAQLEI